MDFFKAYAVSIFHFSNIIICVFFFFYSVLFWIFVPGSTKRYTKWHQFDVVNVSLVHVLSITRYSHQPSAITPISLFFMCQLTRCWTAGEKVIWKCDHIKVDTVFNAKLYSTLFGQKKIVFVQFDGLYGSGTPKLKSKNWWIYMYFWKWYHDK